MRENKCSVCGQISEYQDLIDFSKLEESDLGGLPSFSSGGSYETMVQCCPFCGYCNFDITKNVLIANKLLQTEEYQYILNSQDMDKSVARMAAVAYIYECQNNYYISAKAHSYASKMLEMQGESEKSHMFKEQEARLLLLHISTEYFKKHFDIKIYQYLIDALRRIKKFDKAIKFCDVALTKTYSSVQRNIFLLEKSLCVNYISESHEFNYSNGEFNNFYQILIQGFSAPTSERVYKEMHDRMRAYLEKCVYFPIADGADFILKVDKSNLASMDKMIEELRKTYDRVNGVVASEENGGTVEKYIQEIKIHPDVQNIEKENEQVKVLTLSELEKEEEKNQEIANLKESLSFSNNENEQLLQKLIAMENEREILIKEANVLAAQGEKLQESYEQAKQNAIKIDVEKSAIQEELEEVIRSRRELTADFDMNIYELQNENNQLKAELENLKAQREISEIETAIENKTKSEVDIFENTAENEIENEYSENQTEIAENQEIEEEYIEDIENIGEEPEYFEEVQNQKEDENIDEEKEDIEDIEDFAKFNIELENKEIGDEEMAEFVLDDITEDMILTIAKISGQIDVSEVQGMLLVGYKNAKYALDKISGDGKLQEIEEDLYKFIEV